MNKKIIIIIIIAFLVIIAGSLAIYSIITNDRATLEKEESFFSTIFPFGSDRESIEIEEIIYEIEDEETAEAPRLRHISTFPTAGAAVFVNDDSEEVIRYVEKATGHIYETRTSELGQEKISNTTIPGIYEAVWIDKDSVILRYFNDEDLESFYAELIDGSLEGSFLEKNIKNITVQNGTIRYFSGSTLVRSNPNGTSKTQLYNSPFSEWSLNWWNSNLAFLTTKPSLDVLGSSFFLNVNNGNLTKILGDLPGLTILPDKESDDVLFSANDEGFFEIKSIDTETGDISDGLISALPEKCVWYNKNEILCGISLFDSGYAYPDDWYKGAVSFSDNIVQINMEEGSSYIVEYLTEIDVINPILSSTKDYLIFTNKKDSTLWSLRLED